MMKIIAIFITLVFATITVELWFSACFTHFRYVNPSNGSTAFEKESKLVKSQVIAANKKESAKYWEDVEPTVDGMLSGKNGGLGYLSDADIENSEEFLKTLSKLPNPFRTRYALDCGAGIGRITKDLLSRHFDKVDLVEQNPKFVETAMQSFEGNPNIGEFFLSGLQSFAPPIAKYDVIWIQGVLGYLSDDELVQFLQRCRKALLPRGIIVIKENCAIRSKVEFSKEDSSFTRPIALFEDLFANAGFKVLKYLKLAKLPSNFYPVWSFALSPIQVENSV